MLSCNNNLLNLRYQRKIIPSFRPDDSFPGVLPLSIMTHCLYGDSFSEAGSNDNKLTVGWGRATIRYKFAFFKSSKSDHFQDIASQERGGPAAFMDKNTLSLWKGATFVAKYGDQDGSKKNDCLVGLFLIIYFDRVQNELLVKQLIRQIWQKTRLWYNIHYVFQYPNLNTNSTMTCFLVRTKLRDLVKSYLEIIIFGKELTPKHKFETNAQCETWELVDVITTLELYTFRRGNGNKSI